MRHQIHDNGGRPFEVKINDDRVEVRRQTNSDEYYADYSDCRYDDPPVFVATCDRVWIGKHSEPGVEDSFFDGNSILLHRANDPPLTYVWIGWKIIEWTATSLVVDFMSPVGNSDVPYPYATDVNGTVYLMLERVAMEYWTPVADEDPYGDYYARRFITRDRQTLPEDTQPPGGLIGFMGISKFEHTCDFTWKYNPNKWYDYWSTVPGFADCHITIDDVRQPLTRELYYDIMRRAGIYLGWRQFPSKTLIARQV